MYRMKPDTAVRVGTALILLVVLIAVTAEQKGTWLVVAVTAILVLTLATYIALKRHGSRE